MRSFNATERKILRLLYQTRAPLTTYEIAKEAKISFPTAKKYVEILNKEQLILEDNEYTDPKQYRFNFRLLAQEKK